MYTWPGFIKKLNTTGLAVTYLLAKLAAIEQAQLTFNLSCARARTACRYRQPVTFPATRAPPRGG